MAAKGGLWYTRRDGEVRGPFPAGLVSRHILLGRVRETDEVSTDGKEWYPVADVPELIPEVLKCDLSDPIARERLEAAKRWADERHPERRVLMEEGTVVHGTDQRDGGDRRAPEPAVVVQHRQSRAVRNGPSGGGGEGSQKWALAVIVLVVAAGIGGMAWFYEPRAPEPGPECRAAPRPQVDWDNCFMDGARLSGKDLRGVHLYNARLTGADFSGSTLAKGNFSFAIVNLANFQEADLRGAALVGTSLRRANLSRAQLQDANLSYADLTGAELEGARLDNARLDHAIWPDGTLCGADSTGRCVPAVSKGN